MHVLGVLGVHLQIFPVNYTPKFFLRSGGAGAPTAPPGLRIWISINIYFANFRVTRYIRIQLKDLNESV